MSLRVHRAPRLTDTGASAKRSEIDSRGRAHPDGILSEKKVVVLVIPPCLLLRVRFRLGYPRVSVGE